MHSFDMKSWEQQREIPKSEEMSICRKTGSQSNPISTEVMT